jgi:2-oxoglutarate dehydrogenase E2 component (dihydrolipoamide succinyltransferase)
MVHELKIPQAGESIQEVQIGQWLKQEGQWVDRDEHVVELETDKASMDLPAPVAGVLTKILKKDGEEADIGDTIALIDDAAKPSQAKAAEVQPGPLPEPLIIMPAAQRLLKEHGLQGREVEATGPEGRLLKEDVLRHIEHLQQQEEAAATAATESAGTAATAVVPDTPPAPAVQRGLPEPDDATASAAPDAAGLRHEEIVPMTLIRRRIAERLVQAQHNAALLTTFNEIDMSAVMALRKRHRDRFQEKYDIKLGFMSFFTKAVVESLKEFPALNAEIRGKEIVYRNYYDIGVAIGGGKGLVVPTIRNAERLSFAEIEKQIADFGARAKTNKIRPDELQGGTFTITNGGVYGSLLSTPIINPPQSGVLGLHAIQERPVAVDGQVVIRPMMYVALTYDHRIVDGREAVTFLKRLKEVIEEPARMLLEV